MRKLWLILGILTAPVSLPLAYAACAFVVLSILGYHPDAVGAELAATLADQGGDPRECLQIIHPLPHIMSPSDDEQRANCLYTYASITLDPSVCEFLLPSEYGLACLSTVGGKLFQDMHCHEKAGRIGLYCRGDRGAELVVKSPQIRDCSVYERADVREWCHYIRTYKLAGVYECGNVSRPEARDDCERGYAFKQKDPSLCAAVQDERRQKYCEIRINAWLKYPQLRRSFYFGTPAPIDGEEDQGASGSQPR
ncbi:MAG: hypothetical protein AAB853_01790 [Patescibacteria group bacterium]